MLCFHWYIMACKVCLLCSWSIIIHGRDIGLDLTDVRIFARQLFIALKHLENCRVLHSDIKPDNMLVNEANKVLKLSDFGSAMFAGKNEITPYLVSRFYRAPEIILGLSYDHPMDIWSVGCCLYELYTYKVLFPGTSNNEMLRLHMELKGPFSKKMLRKGAFTAQHFDQDLNFLGREEDPFTKKAVTRLISNFEPKDLSTRLLRSANDDPKMFANFKDLLDKIFVLDPNKRITVSQALSHPFITEKEETTVLIVAIVAWMLCRSSRAIVLVLIFSIASRPSFVHALYMIYFMIYLLSHTIGRKICQSLILFCEAHFALLCILGINLIAKTVEQRSRVAVHPALEKSGAVKSFSRRWWVIRLSATLKSTYNFDFNNALKLATRS